MRGELLALQQVRIDLAARRDPPRHRTLRCRAEALCGRKGFRAERQQVGQGQALVLGLGMHGGHLTNLLNSAVSLRGGSTSRRSEEHTPELQSLMRTSYAVLCLKK